MAPLAFDVIKTFVLATISLVLAFICCPILTKYLYKHRMWKKQVRTKSMTGEDTPIFSELHKDKETSTPRFGGLLIWVTVVFVTLLFYVLSLAFGGIFSKINFLSRSQVWLPLFTLVAGSILGLFDDILVVFGNVPLKIFNKMREIKGKYVGGGISFKGRFLIVLLIGLIGGLWFYFKLGFSVVHVPMIGNFDIGWLIIPLFIIVMLACWSGGIIDGLDGLAGGAFISIFGAFTIIALYLDMGDLAAFCGVIFGALLTFLWFNIPPARFYMGETGMLGLTTVLAVVAFLTNSIVVLPIIGGLLVIESGSVIIQMISKKIFKKKVFLSAPIHHHFEAIGWPAYKVTMRFWIVGIVLAVIGVAIRLMG